MARVSSTTIAAAVILVTTLAGRSLMAQQQPDAVTAEITIHADQPKHTIPPEIYGHFAEHLGRCIYEGIWVGPESKIPNTRGLRNDVLAALKALNVPVLRWPGGCFADEYHWRDGIGPREKRPRIVNTHWGMVPEDNAFGTHEFMDLCEMIGSEAYICGNVGSGTPQEMMEWVEYLTSDGDSTVVRERRRNGREKPWKVKYFGVGNESWGCGGNMRPEYYADLYRRYNTFVKNYPGSKILRIACGSNGPDFNWTDVVMKQAGANRMNGISLHWYTLPTGDWKKKGSATGFPSEQWDSTIANTLRMTELLEKHLAIMDQHDSQKRVSLVIDEWGTWYDPTPGTNPGFLEQQNTIRDAIVAGINLNLFNNRSDRISMTNIAQTINVLQAMILTDKERMLRTPTYHVFEMLKVHQGATLLPSENGPADYEVGGKKLSSVYTSASKDGEGRVNLSLVNARPDRPARVTINMSGVTSKSVAGRILTADAMDAHNTFEHPDAVKPAAFDGVEIIGDKLIVTLPAKSIVTLRM